MNIGVVLAILLAGVLITFISGDQRAKQIALVFSIATLLSTIWMLIGYLNGTDMGMSIPWIQNPDIDFAFKIDGLALAMILLTSVLTPIIILTTWNRDIHDSRVLFALILFMETAMLGTFSSSDGLLYYIFWELSLIPIYFIILFWGGSKFSKRKKTVFTFFIFTFAGSLFMLISIIYLYSQSGNFALDSWYNLNLPAQVQYWVFGGFFLAYAIKIPLIPFHSWQASTYHRAPAYGTMLLAGIMLKMGLYSIIRWQLPVLPAAAETFKPILIGLSLAGVIYGSIITLRQKNIKRFLAYSSLAHVGLIAAGAYSLTADGISGAIVQMLAHGLVIVGLFYIADIIYARYETLKIGEMGGIKVQASKLSLTFMLLILASVALPTTFNFIGEFSILYGLSQLNIWYAVLGGLTIILGAFYMLRMFQQTMTGEANPKFFADLKSGEGFIFALLILLLLFFGIYPQPILDLISPSVQEILQQVNAHPAVTTLIN